MTVFSAVMFAAGCIYLGVNRVWGAFIGYGIFAAIWGIWMLARMALWRCEDRERWKV